MDQSAWFQQGEQAGMQYRLVPPRRALRGLAGFHAGSQRGVSLDFSDYREYHPGDDVRSLDWNVYARTDKLVVKLYHEEVSPHVDLVLDTSRSMALEAAKPQAMLGLGALFAAAAAGGDCSWNAFSLGDQLKPLERGRDVPSVWGEVAFTAQENPGAQLQAGAGQFKRMGVRVLVSDLLWDAEPLTVLRRFSEGASGVVLVQLMAQADTTPPEHGKYRFNDVETGASMEVFVDADAQRRYLTALESHTQLWAEACRQTGAVHCQLTAEELLDGWAIEPLIRAGILEHLQGGSLC
jgi:uncharacterized protein (DUF58 family)